MIYGKHGTIFQEKVPGCCRREMCSTRLNRSFCYPIIETRSITNSRGDRQRGPAVPESTACSWNTCELCHCNCLPTTSVQKALTHGTPTISGLATKHPCATLRRWSFRTSITPKQLASKPVLEIFDAFTGHSSEEVDDYLRRIINWLSKYMHPVPMNFNLWTYQSTDCASL